MLSSNTLRDDIHFPDKLYMFLGKQFEMERKHSETTFAEAWAKYWKLRLVCLFLWTNCCQTWIHCLFVCLSVHFTVHWLRPAGNLAASSKPTVCHAVLTTVMLLSLQFILPSLALPTFTKWGFLLKAIVTKSDCTSFDFSRQKKKVGQIRLQTHHTVFLGQNTEFLRYYEGSRQATQWAILVQREYQSGVLRFSQIAKDHLAAEVLNNLFWKCVRHNFMGQNTETRTNHKENKGTLWTQTTKQRPWYLQQWILSGFEKAFKLHHFNPHFEPGVVQMFENERILCLDNPELRIHVRRATGSHLLAVNWQEYSPCAAACFTPHSWSQ